VGEDDQVKQAAAKIFDSLLREKISVIYDDRDVRPGEKFADADLLGTPLRMVVSKKTLEKQSVELKARTAEETELISIDAIPAAIK
jgi:prolyl-tRNA synthetase